MSDRLVLLLFSVAKRFFLFYFRYGPIEYEETTRRATGSKFSQIFFGSAEDYALAKDSSLRDTTIRRLSGPWRANNARIFTTIGVLWIAAISHTKVVPVDRGTNYWVLEERNFVQRVFGIPGCHRYISDLGGFVIQHGPLRDGDAHGNWTAWSGDKRWTYRCWKGTYSVAEGIPLHERKPWLTDDILKAITPWPNTEYGGEKVSAADRLEMFELKGGWRKPSVWP